MAAILHQPPVCWISLRETIPRALLWEIRRRYGQEFNFDDILPNINCFHGQTPQRELEYVRRLGRCYSSEPETLELLQLILTEALRIPSDCTRRLRRDQAHCLYFFTNFRVIQVYCAHSVVEELAVKSLISKDRLFRRYQVENKVEEQSYGQFTEPYFARTRKYLAWETVFPDGIDMEALSPRDTNAHIRVKQAAQKAKPAPAKLGGKEKDHPPPPPSEVREPPSSDRRDGAIYKTGRCLGKGGFAICYEGQLVGTRQRYALKIVKSYMPQKKMEQKFQTELQIHSKMRHPNIVSFHRAFSFEQCTYIVLELCPNGSLMDMVKKRKYITEPEVRFWTVQMAGAIKYMHAKGIIHRDLKMGNVFLDKNMNVKVGDFGLAALLMSGKDMMACRRTTLCGTPNYIAPEILEKNKGGHDHAVDIWSLGIIIFAMLTGKPPFQSTTPDEIYRRAREREYDWPKLNTSENFISEETKDLVATLLQSPEQRPGPDTIVQHPFFTCGWMPQAEEMTPELCDLPPGPDQFLSIGVRGGRANLYTRNLKKLCIQCEVGPWNSTAKHVTSTYKEVAAEEKAGLTPAVPLPEDVVYRPFDEWTREQAQGPSNDEEAEQMLLQVPAARPTREPLLPSRPATQSFAASQRARPLATTTTAANVSSRTAAKPRQPSREMKIGQGSLQSAVETKSRALLTIPSRRPKFALPELEPVPGENLANAEGRLAADLVEQLKDMPRERRQEHLAAPVSSTMPISLFSPRERVEWLPGTKPDHVLERLQRLQTELERALNSRSIAPTPRNPPPNPTIVVKWVDYTNKFGLGYILSNGSVGCIFRKTYPHPNDSSGPMLPPSCVVVRDAEKHLQSRHNKAYKDREEIVPVSGPNIEFYENYGEKGITRATVNPQNYKITRGLNGEANRLSPGVDDWDDRKRQKVMLWKKFANYMTTYGRDQDYPYDDALARTSEVSEPVAAGTVITFYQRWGDVGCWGFQDGHFQFNFPDHTKIAISADGTWCDFYHLPMEAARDLSEKGTLPPTALDDRQHLSYPVQTLLNFMAKPSRTLKPTARKRPEIDPMIQGIPAANDFRAKVEFVKEAIKEWVQNKGMGISNMEPSTRLRWAGYRELVDVKIPYKHVWTTVGGRNGDDRRVAWFDPRKPGIDIPDVE